MKVALGHPLLLIPLFLAAIGLGVWRGLPVWVSLLLAVSGGALWYRSRNKTRSAEELEAEQYRARASLSGGNWLKPIDPDIDGDGDPEWD